MHNFNYDTQWSPLDCKSPISSVPHALTKPFVGDDSTKECNVSPSFLVTNNNGYNFNDSIDMNPTNNMDNTTNCNPNFLSNGYGQNFKSISIDALTSIISPNVNTNPDSINPDTNINLNINTSPTIIHYLEQVLTI
jgi:hypothetical protein